MIHSFLIKPASSLCNMHCKYCFYADVANRREIKSYGIMSTDISEKLIENIFFELNDGDEVIFAFQGGEPTLAGINYFEHFIEYVFKALRASCKLIKINYSLQTNGLLINDEWCALLAKNKFLVGLSLDGDAQLHDENRVDVDNKGTWKRIMLAKACLQKHKVEYNILWVLTNHAARFPQKIWSFLCANDIQYVQFIPCLTDLDLSIQTPCALSPKRFASFYIELFHLWEQAFQKGEYRSVKLFDDVCNLLSRNAVTACGFTGKCQIQYVIEANGSVYPCDFFVLDTWLMGNLSQTTPSKLALHQCCEDFVHRERTTSKLCEECEFLAMCMGGCPRMRNNMYLYQNDSMCGYRSFLQGCGVQLKAIATRYAR